MVLVINRKALRDFRAACKRAYPNETIGALFGERVEHGLRIDSIEPITHNANEGNVVVKNKHMIASKMKALRVRQDWLGTIHSHTTTPEEVTCPHLSSTDIKYSILHGESICGVVHVFAGGKRTEVHWQVPTAEPVVRYL